MATISKFEDLICFSKARELTKCIYKEFKNCSDFGFKDQITRASVSVLSNIAEGFERGTKNEFLNFLYIAKGSAGEVRAQLYVAYDVGHLNIERFKYLNNLASECSRLIQSFAEKVKKGSQAGTQFKKLEKDDPMKEILRAHAPDVYQRFYPD
jgi:four helix bundle protein